MEEIQSGKRKEKKPTVKQESIVNNTERFNREKKRKTICPQWHQEV